MKREAKRGNRRKEQCGCWWSLANRVTQKNLFAASWPQLDLIDNQELPYSTWVDKGGKHITTTRERRNRSRTAEGQASGMERESSPEGMPRRVLGSKDQWASPKVTGQRS